jgi:hypothetical protein
MKIARQVKIKSMSKKNILQQLQILLKVTKLVNFFSWASRRSMLEVKKSPTSFFCKVATNLHIFWPILAYHDEGIQVCEPKFTTTRISQDYNHREYPLYFNI